MAARVRYPGDTVMGLKTMRFAFAMVLMLFFMGCDAPVRAGDRVFTLRVLTLNLNALPAPLGAGTAPLMDRIAAILRERRGRDDHPHIVLLQEAFNESALTVVENSGYPFRLRGPGAGDRDPAPGDMGTPLPSLFGFAALGIPKLVGSGLYILSDFPVERSAAALFGNGACAGFDCLANKAALWARVRLPDMAVPVDIVTTHMNSDRSAGVSLAARTNVHFQQARILARFLRRISGDGAPLIIAGDVNTKFAPRRAFFRHSVMAIDSSEACLMRPGDCHIGQRTAMPDILDQTNDKHYFLPGVGISVRPVFVTRNFTETVRGRPLSDHAGFEVHYRIGGRPESAPGSAPENIPESFPDASSDSLSDALAAHGAHGAMDADDAQAAAAPAHDMSRRCHGETGPQAFFTLQGLKRHGGRLKVSLYGGRRQDFLLEAPVASMLRDMPSPPLACISLPGSGPFALSVHHDRDADGDFDTPGDGFGFVNVPVAPWHPRDPVHAASHVRSGPLGVAVTMAYGDFGGAVPGDGAHFDDPFGGATPAAGYR